MQDFLEPLFIKIFNVNSKPNGIHCYDHNTTNSVHKYDNNEILNKLMLRKST